MSAVAPSVNLSGSRPRLRSVRRVAALAVGAIAVGSAAGMMAAAGHAWEVIVLVGVFLPVVVWRRPQFGPVVILGAALLIEQFPLNLPKPTGVGFLQVPITNSVPLFQGLGSFHVEPADLMLLSVLVVYLVRSAHDGSRWWPQSHISMAMLGVVVATLIGEAIGLSHHGQMRESFQEIRPFFYLVVTYLLTSVLIRSRGAVEAMLWTLVVAEAIKAIQGIYLWAVTRGWHLQNVLAHEEAMFFSLFFFLVAGLWLFGLRGRLRTVSTSLVPLVFYADVVNDRRQAWAIVAIGLVVMVVVSYAALPTRRRKIRRVVGVVAVVFVAYGGAFWNSTGTMGRPVVAFREQLGVGKISPRDAVSDAYRIQEDANLELNLRMAGPLGAGFGRQIDYAIPMPGLVNNIDPAILYIPHNGVLYVLMRMGVIGGIAFWALFGTAIIAGCRLARCPDPRLAVVGALCAGSIAGWTIEGALDQGFMMYRVMFAMGCMIGLVEAARQIYARGMMGRVQEPVSGHSQACGEPSAGASPAPREAAILASAEA
jgi:hypothetical protein